MGQQTSIEWTHHTFNPWRGCSKVSAGCANCYAEALSRRNPAVLGEWGPEGQRVIASETAWREPLKWDRAAAKAGERRRVFCASMSDVFEERPELAEPRVRLFHLINETPNLDWLLLTKRPENVQRFHGGNALRANNPYATETWPARTHFARNRDIVEACDVLLVAPWQSERQATGGTWYTHDYAAKKGKRIVIVWPDGSVLVK